MIVSLPWRNIGDPIHWSTIERILCSVVRDTECRNLSLSGGLDSTYMLYCMCQVFGNDIDTYTVVGGKDHPDYVYAKMAAEYFKVRWHPYISPVKEEVIRDFYAHLEKLGVADIIACDGVDEFMGGYYSHQDNPTEEHYYSLIKTLVTDHLIPLDEASLGVHVYVPYIDEKLINLYAQIPLSEKVDAHSRKKMMCTLAAGKIPDEIITRRKYGFCDAHRSEPK